MTWRRHCASEDATRDAGEAFASILRVGDVVLLSGQLGAGKTTFVQGVARGLGVRERVTSPTFTIVRQHHCANDQGIATLHHADVYRVQHVGEVLDLNLGELVEDGGVALVEWGDVAAGVFGDDVWRIDVHRDDDDDRSLEVRGEGDATRAELLDVWAGA